MRRVACSMTAKTYKRVPDTVIVSKKSHASSASAWECKNAAQVVALRSGVGSIPASLRISRTVDGAIFAPSTSSSPCRRRYPHPGLAQHQGADRAHRTWPPDAPGPGTLCVSACQQVPVPSQHGVRFDDQVQVPQHTLGQPVQQCCEQGSIARGEPYSVRTQLPLQDGDLMP
jgi:hypothetical protein